jgi:nucleoside 2-deoxyribosyltransferase
MTQKFKVYLAGPISGLTFEQAVDWREGVQKIFETISPEIQAFSPLRKKNFLKDKGVLTQSYDCHPLATDRGINTRDHYDCSTSDLILCNLLGATTVSIGTVMEIAWAFAYRKPLIVAMEDENNLHEHPMIREAISYRVNNLPDALVLTRSILLYG